MSFVRTVLGDIAAEELGTTYCHEHLITLPGEHLSKGSDDMTLDDVEKSVEECRLFAQAGGRTVVEVSCPEYGRDAGRLAEISRRSGVNVIAATGHIMEGYWKGVLDIGALSDEELRTEMLRDLTEGFPEAPDVRAGVIKVGTSKDGPTRDEVRMLTLAAEVQQQTGCAITTHTTAGTAPLEQVRIFREAGADLSKVVIGHQDRRLVWEDHLAVVEAGANLGYDCISKEQYERDSDRIDFIKRLIEADYGDRVMLSGDIARRSYFTSYGGGPGFTYILWRFVPWLHQAGVSREDTQRMLVETPARIFSWTKTG